MSEEKLNIDVSEKEGEILNYDPIQEFGAVSSYDLETTIDKSKMVIKKLLPTELRASDEEDNNPIAGIIDGNPDSKWSVKGRDAWVLMDFGRVILTDKITIDFHMKKNEKRIYDFGIFAVTAELEEGKFEYTSIADNLSNKGEQTWTAETKNYQEVGTVDNLTKIQTTATNKLLFWFTKTSSKRKRFSIIDIKVEGVNLAEVEVGQGTPLPVPPSTEVPSQPIEETEVPVEDNDQDTFGKNGIINLPEYTVLKERLDVKENFQGTSLRFDFKGEKPATSIIIGGLLQINSPANDDISFKTEGAQHNDQNPECGRCNDAGVSYDGKQLRLRKETKHPDYTDNLETKALQCGDLRKKWVGVQWVSQVVTIRKTPDDPGVTGRRFRLYIDENAKKADDTLNNNYELKAEILDLGQFKSGGKATAIINECPTGGKCQAQTTLRLDELKPSQLKTEGLFLRDIEADDGIDEPTDPTEPVKIPPKVIVKPQEDVTSKGQVITVDASKSEDPDGKIVCFLFKQTGTWLVEQRLGLKALTGADKGKCEVTYPSLVARPDKPLSIAVTAVDNDKLEKSLPVLFVDKIDYGTGPPPPEPSDKEVIYDSNEIGKWNSKARLVKTYDPELPKPYQNKGGGEMRASGDPQLDIKGDGTAFLICKAGHGRWYGDVCNYNGSIEWDVMFDGNQENCTCQTRSRHNEQKPPNENAFGGLSAKVSPIDVGLKLELYHNVHSSDIEKKLVKKLEIGKWYRIRYTYNDTPDRKGISQKLEIDYQDGHGFIEVLAQVIGKVQPYWMDKAKFDKLSYYWLRQNNTKTAKLGLRNVVIKKAKE